MDVTDGAAASAPHVFMDAGSNAAKRRRPIQSSGEIDHVQRGGYDATFSRSPPDAKHMCSMCKKVLRQPLQTSCGHRFCASCIRPLMTGGNTSCPDIDCGYTLAPDSLFRDTFAEREILNLDVVCSSVTDGCSWAGKLRSLEEHSGGCHYIKVVCRQNGCPDLIQRRYLDDHRQETCRYRFMNCQHCSTPIVFHTMHEHELECREYPTECPQQCGERLPRRLVNEHVTKGCLLTVVPCRFAFVDCEFKGTRGEMEEHLASDANMHLVQLASVCSLQQRQLSERSREITALQTQLSDVVDHLQAKPSISSPPQASKPGGVLSGFFGRRSSSEAMGRESSVLQHALDRIDELERRVISMDCVQSRNGVLIWKVDDFARRRLNALSGSARHLTSEPFYTSPHGYKLCARVYLNGDGTGLGSHLSLYIIVMKGDYDRVLSWPLSARVTLSLLDQGPSRTHHHHRFHPDARSSSFCRPVGEMNVASGCPQFIHLSGLERHGFVQDDCIVLRVFLDTSNIQGVDSPNFS